MNTDQNSTEHAPAPAVKAAPKTRLLGIVVLVITLLNLVVVGFSVMLALRGAFSAQLVMHTFFTFGLLATGILLLRGSRWAAYIYSAIYIVWLVASLIASGANPGSLPTALLVPSLLGFFILRAALRGDLD